MACLIDAHDRFIPVEPAEGRLLNGEYSFAYASSVSSLFSHPP